MKSFRFKNIDKHKRHRHYYALLFSPLTLNNSSIFSQNGNCPGCRCASTLPGSLSPAILMLQIKTSSPDIIHTSRMLTSTGYLARSSIIYGETRRVEMVCLGKSLFSPIDPKILLCSRFKVTHDEPGDVQSLIALSPIDSPNQ